MADGDDLMRTLVSQARILNIVMSSIAGIMVEASGLPDDRKKESLEEIKGIRDRIAPFRPYVVAGTEELPCIVIAGSPSEGFRIYGPMPDSATASQWGVSAFDKADIWWQVLPLFPANDEVEVP